MFPEISDRHKGLNSSTSDLDLREVMKTEKNNDRWNKKVL